MRVIWNDESRSTFAITLTPALSRRTGRGGKTAALAFPSRLRTLRPFLRAPAP
jgi:hypothetical protein